MGNESKASVNQIGIQSMQVFQVMLQFFVQHRNPKDQRLDPPMVSGE